MSYGLLLPFAVKGFLTYTCTCFCVSNQLFYLFIHSGPIPTELALLTNLRTLALSDNRLTSTLPEGLGKISGLGTSFFFMLQQDSDRHGHHGLSDCIAAHPTKTTKSRNFCVAYMTKNPKCFVSFCTIIYRGTSCSK